MVVAAAVAARAPPEPSTREYLMADLAYLVLTLVCFGLLARLVRGVSRP